MFAVAAAMPRLPALPFFLATTLLALQLTGCQRVETVEKEDGSPPEPTLTACEGALSSKPIALTEVGEDVELIADGDSLLVVEAGQHGRVRRIDRCSGEERARRDIPFLDEAVLHRGQLYFTGISEGPLTYLERWDEPADELIHLADVPFSRLFSHASGLYLTHRIGDGSNTDTGHGVFLFDEATSTLEEKLRIDTQGGTKQIGFAGMTDDGLHHRASYDCGCTPSLELWRPGSADSTLVAGSAGARHVVALGDRVFVDPDQDPTRFGSGIHDIVELSTSGEAPRVLARGEEPVAIQALGANDRWICWSSYEDGVRCVDHRDPPRSVHFTADTWAGALVVAADAVYWVSEVEDGEPMLLAAAL